MVACLKFSGTIDRFCGSFQIYLYAYLQVKPLFYLQATYSLKVPYSIKRYTVNRAYCSMGCYVIKPF